MVKLATDSEYAYWTKEIQKAKKRYGSLWDKGNNALDVYSQQKEDGSDFGNRDKYNILYSSVETIRPNLYANRPVPIVEQRNREATTPVSLAAAMLLEGCLSYVLDEGDFDNVMESCVEDFLLPGMGNAWVRYEPHFKGITDPATGKPLMGPEGQPEQELIDEKVIVDYVYWKDMLYGVCRQWQTLPWGARRIWLTKDKATKRFGAEKAEKLQYAEKERGDKDEDNSEETAEAWEIWDKRTRTAYWYAETYKGGLLDKKKDPMRLKGFFPFPRPMRAVSTNRTFVPKPFYEQYRSQAETIDTLTKRIRLLTEALRVTGVYDGEQETLKNLLLPNAGNRMISVDSWAAMQEKGGLKGVIEWLPIKDIVEVLMRLFEAREIAKNEIYEITGFSDVIRGVSKASETLGAQNLKANWAGARVKKQQKDVQRFARDLIALAGEIIAEHCAPETVVLFSGLQLPKQEEAQADPELAEKVQTTLAALEFIKNDALRLATINIETDSTIMADEEAERNDRMQFLSSAGAFLQQAVPAVTQTPALGPLLGAMLMFSVRTFPSARSIEDAFKKVEEQVLNAPPPAPPDDGKEDAAAKAQTAIDVANVRASSEKERTASAERVSMAEAEAKSKIAEDEVALKAMQETNRHNEKMRELDLREDELILREREVAVKEAELGIKQQAADTAEFAAEANADNAERQADTAEFAAEANADNAERMAENAEQAQYAEQEKESRGESSEGGLTDDD